MDNQELKLKTNLNCGGCVSKVQADFDNAQGISNWSVNINNSDKILTVSSKGITEDEVIKIVQGKGFKAEIIK